MKSQTEVNPTISLYCQEIRRTDNFELQGAAYNLKSDVARLYEAADAIQRKMAQVMERCKTAEFSRTFNNDFYLGINSLGELQGQGPAFDVLCAMTERSVKEFNHAIKNALSAAPNPSSQVR